MNLDVRLGVHSKRTFVVPDKTICASVLKPFGARGRAASNSQQVFVVLEHAACHANLPKVRLLAAAFCLDVSEEHQVYKMHPDSGVLIWPPRVR